MPGQGLRRRDRQPHLRPRRLRHRGEVQGAALGIPLPLRPRHRGVGQVLRGAQGVHQEQVNFLTHIIQLLRVINFFFKGVLYYMKG